MASQTLNENLAIIVGASGAIGGTLADMLERSDAFDRVIGFSRRSDPPLDLADNDAIANAARHVAGLGSPRLVICATGFLHDDVYSPEKSVRQLDPDHMARSFALNTIGPAMVLKHFAPLLPRTGRSVIAMLSARVGSIADNRLGGWHSYRASKAALNQIVRTASVELARTRQESLCVAVHPGTVASPLSAPFSKSGLDVQKPERAARQILDCLETLTPSDSGSFFDRTGATLPW